MNKNPRLRQWSAACMAACLLTATLPSTTHAEAASDEAGEGTELPVAPDYFPMPSLNIPMLRKNRLTGSLRVDMVLDVATDEAMGTINEKRTLLIAGYADALGRWAAAFQEARAPVNGIAIKNQLQTVTNEVLGRTDAVVLLQGATINR